MNNLIKISVVLFALVTSLTSFSQKRSQTNDKVSSPYFLVISDETSTDQLPLKSTSAQVNIVGVIADVTINQVYKNEGKNTLECIYIFPASANAAIYAMEMTIGKRKIIATIEEKQKARRDYETAKQQGKRTSLLEQHRPNVFQMNVANILPGDEIMVSMKYTEILVPNAGIYEFVYPTVVGPRYSSAQENNNSFVSTPYLHEGEKPTYNFDININLSAGMCIQDISCKTHEVKVFYPSTDEAKINLSEEEAKGGNRDFVLQYQLSGDKIASGLMLYEHEDENFFMMMIQPPKRIENTNIPPREYIFINDVSGSMNGYPMDVSKKIMRNLVSNLRPEDRFNVLVFAGTSGWMADKSLSANNDNINRAIHFIENQRGSGGTEILRALKKALSFPREYEEMSRTFVIVTDGYVSVEKEVFDLIRNNNDKANTFVFGIGSSVNRYIIDGMAHAGMGEAFVVLDRDEANQKAEKFRKYISNPVLTQIKTTFSNFEVYDVEPLSIADVFAERPVIIFGKYKGTAQGSIKLKGYSGRKRWESKFEVSKVKPHANNVALRYLWARKRIQMLDDYSYLVRVDNKNEVTELGLKYNLLTNYTSFIAIEESEEPKNPGEIVTVKQPLPLPKNVSNYAVGFELVMEDEMEFEVLSYYDKIEFRTPISNSKETEIQSYIENKLMPQLDDCLSKINGLESILITITKDGKVKTIKFNGKTLSEKSRACLEEKIRQWVFNKFATNKEFTFEIVL